MSPGDLVLIAVMSIAAMTLMTFWRKVLLLLLSVFIAVFVYGVVSLTHAVGS